jgi:hypothetical protein
MVNTYGINEGWIFLLSCSRRWHLRIGTLLSHDWVIKPTIRLKTRQVETLYIKATGQRHMLNAGTGWHESHETADSRDCKTHNIITLGIPGHLMCLDHLMLDAPWNKHMIIEEGLSRHIFTTRVNLWLQSCFRTSYISHKHHSGPRLNNLYNQEQYVSWMIRGLLHQKTCSTLISLKGFTTQLMPFLKQLSKLYCPPRTLQPISVLLQHCKD